MSGEPPKKDGINYQFKVNDRTIGRGVSALPVSLRPSDYLILDELHGLSPDRRTTVLEMAAMTLGIAPKSVPKPRKPSIRTIIVQAEKATGKAVTAVTLPDGTRLDFNKPTNATADDEVESWLSKQKGH